MTTTIDKLLKEFLPSLKLDALKCTQVEQDADDLLQDVALKVLLHQDKIGEMPYDEQTAYTARVFHNAFIDTKRRDVRRCKNKTRSIEDGNFLDGSNSRYCIPFVRPEVESKIDFDDMVKQMGKVHKSHRIAIAMNAAGYNTKEISKRFGVNLNTAVGFVRYGRTAAIKISEGVNVPKSRYGTGLSQAV